MKIPLLSGAYSAQSLIASAQRAINIYAEMNPQDTSAPMPVTHYQRPGLTSLGFPPAQAPGRCLYRSTRGVFDPSGDLFAVVGQGVYVIDPNWTWTLLGTLITPAGSPVLMADNGQDIVVVDNSQLGYQIAIPAAASSGIPAGAYVPPTSVVPPPSFTQIGDPNFLGSTGVDFIDSFLIFNNPGTNQWYSTQSSQVLFNPLYIGVKTAWPDNILRVVAIEREVWVFGPQKSEPWFNAGAVPFPFQIVPGIIIEQGCAAAYSVAKMDTNVYWLSESPEGARMFMKGNAQNVAQRISTHAIEAELLKYARVDDAIGSVYQIAGHSFYRCTFPTEDKTWVYDQATEQWFEDNWIDQNGIFHRARNTFCAYAYGKNLGLDWATGQLYQIDPQAFTDAGHPIAWVRSFPHVIDELKRINHVSFVADIETGELPGSSETTQIVGPWSNGFSSGFGPLTVIPGPVISMRYSNDGGHTWSNNRMKSLISAGHYRSMMRWRGLGRARDRVYELSGSVPMPHALQGAYLDAIQGSS
jgi:hypothetical protein